MTDKGERRSREMLEPVWILQPLSVIMETFHWSEVTARRELRLLSSRVRHNEVHPCVVRPVSQLLCHSNQVRPEREKVSSTGTGPSSMVFPIGIPALDEELLGGLRSQFLTEFISPMRSSTFSVSRYLVARMVKGLLTSEESCSVLWLHPEPDENVQLLHLFEGLPNHTPEEGSGEASPTKKLRRQWMKRLLVSAVQDADELHELSLTLQRSLQSGGSGLPGAPLQLVVVEEFTLLMQRSFDADASSIDRAALVSAVVDVWKSMALEYHLVVIFLSTGRVELDTSAPSYLHVADELSRAFSHSMNIRLCVYPGWFRSVHPVTGVLSSYFHKIKILKSPLCGDAVIPFKLHEDHLSSLEEKKGAFGEKRGREWLPEALLCALEPLDYILGH